MLIAYILSFFTALIVSVAVSFLWHPGAKALPPAPSPPSPFCGCTHHYCFHDPETGKCHVKVDGPLIAPSTTSAIIRGWVERERVQCPCRRYTGPEPLPDYFIPQIGE